MKQGKPKAILLKQIPDEIWNKMCETKRKILSNNKNRDYVSHTEAIYKLIQNNCNE
jgi:hypothetical protein